ncbi:MAG TPA: hypothetical protein VN840_06580 [Streptosporangiaceae bacterium]|nr:hypothetical protein [Streptosporangiaceae bacterium]
MRTPNRSGQPQSPGQPRTRSRLAGPAGVVSARSAARAVTARAAGRTAAVLVGCAAVLTAAACSSASGPAKQAAVPGARPAPATWHRATLPGGGTVLAYPPSMHLVHGDSGTVTAAEFGAAGRYLLYLNVTPKQGAESLRGWAAFRVDHQREDDASAVHEVSAETGVRFLGGTGSCVTDAYVTRVGAHHFTEIACFVRGRTSATVIVAAAPTADWATAAGTLRRAIAGYLVR